jgi:ribosomal protein L37AE/L43A
MTISTCPECGKPMKDLGDQRWKCLKCNEVYAPTSVTAKEDTLPTTKSNQGVSDITRKQLERIVEAEGCRIVLMFGDDTAVVFRGDTVETLIPPGMRGEGPENVPQTARNVLLTLALFQNPGLLKLAEEILAEAQKILDNDSQPNQSRGERNADKKREGDPEDSE